MQALSLHEGHEVKSISALGSASRLFGGKSLSQCGAIVGVLGSIWDRNHRNLGISLSPVPLLPSLLPSPPLSLFP